MATPTAAKVIELQHNAGATLATEGFGTVNSAVNDGGVEIYSIVELWRETA